ncbi:MAG: hypothetical protein ABL958_13270 [Bdellovibrionia bacterium]
MNKLLIGLILTGSWANAADLTVSVAPWTGYDSAARRSFFRSLAAVGVSWQSPDLNLGVEGVYSIASNSHFDGAFIEKSNGGVFLLLTCDHSLDADRSIGILVGVATRDIDVSTGAKDSHLSTNPTGSAGFRYVQNLKYALLTEGPKQFVSLTYLYVPSISQQVSFSGTDYRIELSPTHSLYASFGIRF